ncbi:hypothetical protein AAT19DRAFT_10740 [Rhodotorula toruloides]|uniref:Uncharacterized protein n=1 Tax=Rhodotorula toruloides TaxID=5286 RepID=A0A2S9ZZL9_RHOTO|nr:hypothetical protein AAT19DRAFT_10740 [Rhodotorula toruloides]
MSVVIKSQTADETVYKVTGLGPKLEVEIVIQNNKFSKTYDSIPPKDIVQGIEEITQLFQAILALQQQQIWKTLSASGKLFLLEQIEKSMALKSASANEQALQVDAPSSMSPTTSRTTSRSAKTPRSRPMTRSRASRPSPRTTASSRSRRTSRQRRLPLPRPSRTTSSSATPSTRLSAA